MILSVAQPNKRLGRRRGSGYVSRPAVSVGEIRDFTGQAI